MAVEKLNGSIISFLKEKDYILVNNNLGSGSFGKTVILKDPYIDELFVAKKYEPESEEIREAFYKNFLDEIKILYKLNHPNIVRIFNYYAYEQWSTGYILMEFIDGSNVADYMNEYKVLREIGLEIVSLDSIFVQLIDAFSYMEDHHIIHRDIRESNIMVDQKGVVKIIDFGIGKIFDPNCKHDSLAADINRADADTLPREYYSGEYTSLTDMFYLAELLNRVMGLKEQKEKVEFSYQKILDKMMSKNPEERYPSFKDIQEAIGKHDFTNLDIPDKDKKLYQKFSDSLFKAIAKYTSEPKFITDPKSVIERLKHARHINAFEDIIQDNKDVISCIVSSTYRYYPSVKIATGLIANFLEWFQSSTLPYQELILTNLIAKLSCIEYVEPEDELPF